MVTGFPRVSKKGFDLKGSGGQVLLLHGYTGTPYDLRPLAEFLHSHNMRVVVPLLKGHGTKPEHLFRVHADDWIRQSEEIIGSFDERRPIIVGGLSMGAFLATRLASLRPNMRALLLFSPAFCMGLAYRLVLASAQFGLLSSSLSLKKISGGSDIMDPLAKQKSPCYKEMPLAGLLQFEALRMLARDLLPEIQCPVFMAFGRYDSAINIYDSHQLAMDKIRQPVFAKFYDNSKHVITLDYDKAELFSDIWQFLKQPA